MGIITNKLNAYSSKEAINCLTDEINATFIERKTDRLYANQMECAIECLKEFDSNLPRPNHLVVQGKTQAGKTGVLLSIMMLITKLNIEEVMSIDRIFYLTGDNSRRLLAQTKERLKAKGLRCEVVCMKNSDLKKDLERGPQEMLTNSLIFIDESHYGTSDAENILIKWMENNRLDMHNNKNLVEKNVYIVSNSATPYGELNSDLAKCKSLINLITDGNYVGFEEYYHSNCFCPISNNNLNVLIPEMYEHLKHIEDVTGKHKCAVLRMGKKTYEKYKPLIDGYFHSEAFFAEGENINYDGIHCKMMTECDNYDKPLAIIIAGAYRMGITIPEICKRNIGCVYDFASGSAKENVIATEQGLLGRMTGYWNSDDWNDVSIYINKKHYEGLQGCYVEKKTSTPQSNRNNKCFIENENGEQVGIVGEESYIVIPCDNVIDNKEYNIPVKEYVEQYFKNENKPLNAVFIAGRKYAKVGDPTNPDFFANGERTEKVLSDETNVGKYCYTTLYNINEGIIKIRYGRIVRGNYVTAYDESKKVIDTLATC